MNNSINSLLHCLLNFALEKIAIFQKCFFERINIYGTFEELCLLIFINSIKGVKYPSMKKLKVPLSAVTTYVCPSHSPSSFCPFHKIQSTMIRMEWIAMNWFISKSDLQMEWIHVFSKTTRLPNSSRIEQSSFNRVELLGSFLMSNLFLDLISTSYDEPFPFKYERH